MTSAPTREAFFSRTGLLAPIVILYLLFFVFPLVFMFPISIKGYQPGIGIIDEFTLEHYEKVLGDAWYRQVLLRTLALGGLIALIDTVLAWPIAYFLAKSTSRFRHWLTIIIVFPLFLNLVVRSFGWIALLSNRGLINETLLGLGLITERLSLIYNFTGILIGLTHIFLPFSVLVITSAIQNIPKELEVAAISLGSSRLRAIWDITMPLSLPGVRSSLLLVFVLTISALVTPRLLGGSNYQVMATLIYEEFMILLNWPSGAALAYTLLVVVIGILILASLIPHLARLLIRAMKARHV